METRGSESSWLVVEIIAPLADTRRIRELEKQLQRKDKALAETAALLVLQKRVLPVLGAASAWDAPYRAAVRLSLDLACGVGDAAAQSILGGIVETVRLRQGSARRIPPVAGAFAAGFSLVAACSSSSGAPSGAAALDSGGNAQEAGGMLGQEADGMSGPVHGDDSGVSGPGAADGPRAPPDGGTSLLHDVQAASVGGVYAWSVATFLAVNDSALFWANSEVIHRINLSDGTDTTLLDHSSNSTTLQIYGVTLDGSNLYFAERGFQSGTRGLGVAKIPLDGSSGPTTIVDAPYIASPVVVADGYLYFQVSNPTGPYVTTLQRVAVGGGTPTALIANVAGGLGAMAVGGGYLWFSLANAMYRIPVSAQAVSGDAGMGDGGPTDDAGNPLIPGAEIVDPNGGASELTIDANRLYGASGQNLWALPLTGGQRTTLAQAPILTSMFGDMNTDVRALALHGGWIYWSHDVDQYADLDKTPVTGGQTVAAVPKSPASVIAINSSKIYFVTPDGRVYSGPQ